MQARLRFIPSAFAATIITAGLVSLMHFLVQYDAAPQGERISSFEFQFRQVIPETKPIKPDDPDKPKLEQPEPPPPTPEKAIENPDKPTRTPVSIDVASLPGLGGPSLIMCSHATCSHTGSPGSDRHLVPIARIEPPYPRRAAVAGVEGWVRVSFTVTETGAVVDPRIEEASPPRVFDQAVLGTITKWKFRPQVSAQGTPMRVRAVQTLDFKL